MYNFSLNYYYIIIIIIYFFALIYNPRVPPIEEARTTPRTTQQIIIIIFFYITPGIQEASEREREREGRRDVNGYFNTFMAGLGTSKTTSRGVKSSAGGNHRSYMDSHQLGIWSC